MKTLEDWIKEHYPVKAQDLVSSGAGVKKLIKHARAKWEGLKEEVLREHDILPGGMYLNSFNGYSFLRIAGSTCTLCLKYIEGRSCTKCPIYLSRGKVQCDQRMENEVQSPWWAWCEDRNPLPMIEALQKAQEYAENHPEVYSGDEKDDANDGQ